MFIWPIVQIGIIIIVLILGITQLVIPAFTGKPFFGIIRKPERELTKVQEELSDAGIMREVGKVRDEIKHLTDKE